MPLQSERSDTIKALASVYRALLSAAMPEDQSFHTLPMPNSHHRREQEGDDDNAGHHHDDDDGAKGKEEQGKPLERICDETQRFKPADGAEPRGSISETLRAPSSSARLQASSSRKMDGEAESKGMDRKKFSGCKTTSAVSVVRTSASDGYNWRKYGQKQVKSPTGSRSYYRCSHSNCCAKKIEFRDHLNHVIEIIYKNQHSHEPLWKTNSSGEIKLMPSNEPTVETSVPEQPTRVLNDSDSSPPKRPIKEVLSSTDKKRQKPSGLSENGEVIMKEEHVDEPELKRRVKKEDCLDSDKKPGKKSVFAVHAAEDVGISGDGYRWRKYGQKMVKGNPNPRNYYRCTSAGCPVRKQIETAADNSNAAIITYKGVHDHDIPVPKKRHGRPSAPLMAAAAPASNDLHLKNTDALQNQNSSPQSSVDTEEELMREALDLGGEKAIESARTLLSIGFEIKPS